MLEAWHRLRGNIARFIESYGIDPVYAVCALMVILVITQAFRVKHWNDLPEQEQGLLKALFIAAGMAILAGIFRYAGVF